jgi:hypothetical protein
MVACLWLGLTSGLCALPAGAQGATEQIARGDNDHSARSAHEHHQQALLAEPKNYEALWKAALTATGLAELAKRRAAHESFEWIARAPVCGYPDPLCKQQAAALLRKP